MLNSVKFCQILIFLVLFATVHSIIITSVYAGRKKYKTYSFDKILPPIVIEKPNNLQMSYHGHWTFRRPKFRIKFNFPLHLPINFITGDNYQQNYQNQEYRNQDYFYSNQLPSKPMYFSSSTNNQIVPSEYASEKVEIGKRPYTGTAQITSFIDNGHIISAHQPIQDKLKHYDEFHSPSFLHDSKYKNDQDLQMMMSSDDSPRNIKRVFTKPKRKNHYGVKMIKIRSKKGIKTQRLGYRGYPPESSLITAHANIPDSIPLSLPRSAIYRYYGSLNFSNNLKNGIPYEPKVIGLGSNKLFTKLFG